LGGYLVDQFGWRSSFAVLAIIGGAVLGLAAWRLPETLSARLHESAGGGGLRAAWDGYRIVLRSPVFVGFCLVTALSSGGYFAFVASAPFIVVNLLGRTPTEYGLGFLFVASGYMCGNFVAARYSVRVGIDRMVIAGCV